jgi:hypothetical protein
MEKVPKPCKILSVIKYYYNSIRNNIVKSPSQFPICFWTGAANRDVPNVSKCQQVTCRILDLNSRLQQAYT